MRPASLAALTLAGVAVAAAAAAQQRRPFPPLPVPAAALEAAPLSFTLSQSLEADTNYDLVNDPAGTTYYGETRFALDYLRAAETSLLSLGLDTGLRGVEHPDDDFEWVAASPSTAYLDYRAEGVDTLFDLGLTARSRIVNSTTTVVIEGDPTDPDDPGHPRPGRPGRARVPLRRRHRLHRRDELAEHLGRADPRQHLRLRRDRRAT